MQSEPASKPSNPLREITPRVIVLGLLLSVVMGAANVYVGLKVGMTVSASIPAAVMAMLIFRFFKKSSILEANQVQTAASAGESLAAGIIFTMPALLMIGYWTEFDFWTVTGVAFTGGLLGILLMIPMRKVFVRDNDELPYPEGIACAAVLKAGESEDAEGGAADPAAAKALIFGGLFGGVFKLLQDFVGLFHLTLEGATAAGSRILYMGGDISPMLVAVGLIVRLNVAALIFIGGSLGWLIGIPLLGGAEAFGDNPLDGAHELWSTQIRYMGVGAMVVGGIASIVSVRKGLVAAVNELRGRGEAKGEGHGERDLPGPVIVGLAVAAIALVAFLYYGFTNSVGITLLCTAVMLVMAFLFTAVASYIVGLVGNSNSPVSGMTITAVLFTGSMLWMFGYSGTEGMVAILGVAAIICCVACTSGDVCNDLKTGLMVGASPIRQQTMQILGVLVGSLVMAPTLTLLHENVEGGIGGRELSAPQAGLFASLARAFAGEGEIPKDMVAIGAVLGVLILLIDSVLKKRGTKFRAHLMPIAVGIYLPFGLATPILIGGVIAHFATRGAKSHEEEESLMHRGVLFSSGIIAGEALIKLGIAGLAAGGIMGLGLELSTPVITGLTWLATAVTLFFFLRVSLQRRSAA